MNTWIIRALATPDSHGWLFVRKGKGAPFTYVAKNARRYKTYESASRAMDKLRANAAHWSLVGNNCEVSKLS